MSMLHALKNTTTLHSYPYNHWLMENALDNDMLAEIINEPIPDGRRVYDGTRAADNGAGGGDGVLRCYVGKDNIHRFPALKRLIDDLSSPATIVAFENILKRDLSNAYVRLEVIADRKGFWLKPHVDIKEKLMSMLVYANVFGEAESLGTDIYDNDIKLVKTIPYRHNIGYLFAPDVDTWHGLELKEIKKERRSLLINYVTFETDWKLPTFNRMRAAA